MMTTGIEGIDMWLSEAVNLPLSQRCNEVGRLLDACKEKELEVVFQVVVGDVFGVATLKGWGLHSTFQKYAPADFHSLVRFLGPQGPVFRACYHLLANCHLKFQFPLTCLPTKIKKLIEDGSVPPFYLDKIYIDHQTRMVSSLQLNAFEFYMFHFAYHLVNPWLQRASEPWLQWDTPYMSLFEEYLAHLLPCEGSVQPYAAGPYPPRTITPLQVSPTRPISTPTLLRASALLSQSSPASSRHPSPISARQAGSRTEIWRSETAVQVFVDYWLNCGERDTQNSLGVPLRGTLPCVEHIRVVRNFIKYLHYFANSVCDEVTALNELKRCTIQQWPLDSSFRLILETWLSFIQPWRYTDWRGRRCAAVRRTDEEGPQSVSTHWLGFVAENLLAYTVVFQQLVPRFSRIDLSMPKNSHMLYRVTKVFSQLGLSAMLSEVERSVEGPGGFPERVHLRSALAGQGHKWSAIVRQQMLELEGLGFVYEPLFSHKTGAQICRFIMTVQEARCTAQQIVNLRELERLKQSTGFFSWLKEFFSNSVDSDEYTLDDRKKVIFYLDSSRDHLLNIFQLDVSQIPECQDVSAPGTPGSEEIFRTPDTSIHYPLDDSGKRVPSPRVMPQRLQQKLACLGYEGDPDLQPIKSSEIAFLVRMLYQVSSKINEMYCVEIFNVYHRMDLWGRMARQVLQPPLRIREYDKSASYCFSPLVEKVLPPRLSLRSLAAREKAIQLFLYLLLMWFLLGYGPVTSVVCLLALYFVFVFIRALVGPLFADNRARALGQDYGNVPSSGLDESFNEQSFLS